MVKKLQNFKRIAALTIAMFAVSFGLKAQTWFIMGEYIWSPPHPQGTFEELHVQGDDVEINGMAYHTILESHSQTILGAYRNEDRQVYYCKWNGSDYDEEVMLYDYDLEVGDFFNDSDEHPMEVISVSYIADNNGMERKKIKFSFLGLEDETEYWIEGIGSNRGFIHSGNYTPTDDGAIFHLLCYHVGENLIYVSPEYNACDIDEINEENAIDQISVYPNPASGTISILNPNGMSVTKVDIIDLLGRVVLSSEKTDSIDVSSLSEGQYFVRIQGESTVVKKLSITQQ